MRNSAVWQHPPQNPRWPTACPWCGAYRLAYQYEEGSTDVYRCVGCLQFARVRDRRDRSGGWRRTITRKRRGQARRARPEGA